MPHPRQVRAGPFLIAIALLAIGVVACGSSGHSSAPVGTTAKTGGGVRGHVLAGPTCPVARAGHPCPPKPVRGAVEIVDADGRVRASAHTDAKGAYSIDVSTSGRYTVRVADASGDGPRCPHVQVIVRPLHVTTADVMCDTGIR